MFRKRIEDTAVTIFNLPSFPYILLALITLMAAGLRFFKLGEWSLWIDEIFTINHAMSHFSTPALILEHIPPGGNWIPLSVILTGQILHRWSINPFAARLVAATVGIITVPVLYFLVRKLFDVKVALIAVLLLALSTWHIEWSQNARFYTSLLLFYTLALFFFHYGIERDRPLYLFIFLVLTYVAASERFTAVFIIPVALVYLLLLKVFGFEKPAGFNKRNVLITLFPVLGGILIEIVSYSIDRTFRVLGGFDWFALYQLESPLKLLLFTSYDIGIPLVCFAFFSGTFLVVKKSRIGLLLLVSAVLPVLLLIALNPFLFTLSRYVFITLSSWIILAAVGIWEVFSSTKGYGKIIAVGLLLLFVTDSAGANLVYYKVNNGNRLDWERAFSYVQERRQTDDEVVTSWPQWEGYYWDKKIVSWERLSPEAVETSSKRYWFILDNEIIWGNPRMKAWIEQDAELMDILSLRRENEYYLKIYLYDPVRKLDPAD
jgi:mannosyltransferase